MNRILLLTLSLNTCFALFSQTSVTAPDCIIPFYHGVASGDPLSDRVIIWTRVTPDDFQLPAVVSYRVATDTAMTNIVNEGSVLTNADKDFTVKVDVTGLSPNTFYYYEFEYNTNRSQRGRTKTTPVGAVDNLRFAIVSCANLEAGYFNTYRIINERNDVDAILMLGDYIYEYGTGEYSPNPNVDREFQPETEILSLDDYRLRYSIYHMDEALRLLHQNFPWICVWDDHESANDSYKDGAENHNVGEGDWQERKLAAQKAFFEWLPIREKSPENYEIFRTFKYGDLVDLFMVDTRLHGRDEQVGATSGSLTDPTRSMLGEDQNLWLKDELSESTAQWKILGNQVVMAKLTLFGTPINTDAWDGYPTTRQGLYDHILTNNIENFVVVTGDIHTSWAFDLKSGTSNVGVEFVTPSVTSPGSPIDAGSALMWENPHLKWVELTRKGFIVLDVNAQRIQADWFFLNTIDQISNDYTWARSYYSNSGMSQLVNTNTATMPSANYNIAHAPLCPRVGNGNASVQELAPKVIALYPNPVMDELKFHFYQQGAGQLTGMVLDLSGRELKSFTMSPDYPAFLLNVSDLQPSTYYLKLVDSEGRTSTVPFVKQ
jgi:alkaline phosphatase D